MNEIKLKSCSFCDSKVHINENTECTDFAKELANIYDKHSDLQKYIELKENENGD